MPLKNTQIKNTLKLRIKLWILKQPLLIRILIPNNAQNILAKRKGLSP
jgi:hypothetical protein